MKKALKITGLILLVLTITAFAVPFLFKKQITNLVKKEINNNIVKTIRFKFIFFIIFTYQYTLNKQ